MFVRQYTKFGNKCNKSHYNSSNESFFLTTTPITLSSPTENTTNNPLEQLRTEIDQNIRDGKQNIVKLAAALIALEESNSQLRNQLKANTTHLQLFLKSIQDYEQKLTNNWQMKMLLETAKSQIQTLVKSFDLINYRLNKLLRND